MPIFLHQGLGLIKINTFSWNLQYMTIETEQSEVFKSWLWFWRNSSWWFFHRSNMSFSKLIYYNGSNYHRFAHISKTKLENTINNIYSIQKSNHPPMIITWLAVVLQINILQGFKPVSRVMGSFPCNKLFKPFSTFPQLTVFLLAIFEIAWVAVLANLAAAKRCRFLIARDLICLLRASKMNSVRDIIYFLDDYFSIYA